LYTPQQVVQGVTTNGVKGLERAHVFIIEMARPKRALAGRPSQVQQSESFGKRAERSIEGHNFLFDRCDDERTQCHSDCAATPPPEVQPLTNAPALLHFVAEVVGCNPHGRQCDHSPEQSA
jgi:hypothetical protein